MVNVHVNPARCSVCQGLDDKMDSSVSSESKMWEINKAAGTSKKFETAYYINCEVQHPRIKNYLGEMHSVSKGLLTHLLLA